MFNIILNLLDLATAHISAVAFLVFFLALCGIIFFVPGIWRRGKPGLDKTVAAILITAIVGMWVSATPTSLIAAITWFILSGLFVWRIAWPTIYQLGKIWGVR